MRQATADLPLIAARREADERARVEQEQRRQTNQVKCTFPDGFHPNPGGQQRFADIVGIYPPKDTGLRTLWLRGGVGAGKSFIGSAFAAGRALADPQSRGLITANSYGQLETSTLVALAEFCRMYGIPLEPTANLPIDSPEWPDLTAKRIAARRLCTIFGAPVLVLSADAFTGTTERAQERGRGLQIRWFWADEFAYADGSAFNTLNTRLGRGSGGSLKGLGIITSSINKNAPYNWAYELFDAPNRDERQQQKFVSIPLSTFENQHLDGDYVESQAAALTDELYRIEILGEYATVTSGRIFNTFNRAIHALFGNDSGLLSYDPRYDLYLSFDFNHDPATAIAAQMVNGDLRVIREWFLRDSDTFELSSDVALWLQGLGHRRGVFLYGDATGNQKTANSRKTNWEIVWSAFRVHGSQPVKRYGKVNPSVQDSINSVKLAFRNDKVFINGDTCPELIKDLETLQWRGNDIDKRDLLRSHLADELRYLVDTLWPYRGTKAQQRGRAPMRGVPL